MWLASVSVLTIFAGISIYRRINFEYIPVIDENLSWGPGGNCRTDDGRIYPFKIEVTSEELKDFYYRLNHSRNFSEALENTHSEYGTTHVLMKNITAYLKKNYRVKQRMAFLNNLPQYKTRIQGLDIHYIHVKTKTEKHIKLLPILLLHGWPSSVREFYEFVPNMTTPQKDRNFIFELIMPSLPGFGYSDGASKPGCKGPHIASMFKQLMNRLGHKTFLVHGSDWGAIIGTQMATLYPDAVLGFHSNFCVSLRSVTLIKTLLGSIFPSLVAEYKFRDRVALFDGPLKFYMYESGYMHLFGTKPDTIGHGLDNSPEGLISFLIEKLMVGTNKMNAYIDDAGLSTMDIEKIMDIFLFYYWFPRKATTSGRIYAENLSLDGLMNGLHNVPIKKNVSIGCAFFEHELLYQPQSFLRDKFPNLVHYKTYETGGHFASIESPEIMIDDISLFVKKIIHNL